MRIVQNLDNITECPNCGNGDLDYWYNINTQKHSKHCAKCGEEMFEKESGLDLIGFDLEGKEGRVTKYKENFIFEMREEINHLSWSIHDAHSMVLVGNIQNILNRIIDYIEEN
jgi:predicted nucleic-acid-binding Zn-ribbon protein